MILNSVNFILFFIVVFALYYYFSKKYKAQNIVLLIASYAFYAIAAWKMLPLLIVCTIIFYYLGLGIGTYSDESKKKLLMTCGVLIGIGTLLYFKYLNFFIDEFGHILSMIGIKNDIHSFGIIMPVGISYFTFRLISYVVDIYHGKINATRDIVSFATYVAFFPCILAGPIDRPKFINQLSVNRRFDYNLSVDACRQFLWGLFKKLVIADRCAIYVNEIWGDYSHHTGSTLVLAMVLYFFQMYADFSGYSDMAIAVGKLLGLKITPNFKAPLFSLNMKDFWQRWHMSLTSWITDYVFIPLNIKFRNLGKFGMLLAIIINMVVVGLWHGANWTYALFGLYHGLLFIPLIYSGAFSKKTKIKTYNNVNIPIFQDVCKMILTLSLFTFGMIIFRAESLVDVFSYLSYIFNDSLLSSPWLINRGWYIPLAMSICFMIILEWIYRADDHALKLKGINNVALRYMIYLLIVGLCAYYAADAETYIYVQF